MDFRSDRSEFPLNKGGGRRQPAGDVSRRVRPPDRLRDTPQHLRCSPPFLGGILLSILLLCVCPLMAQQIPKVKKTELQPLVAQVRRLVEALDYLGVPLRETDKQTLEKAMNETEASRALADIQTVLDSYCLFDVYINPESRVKVAPGPAKAELQEQGWRSFLVKVRNEAGVTAQLKAESPNAMPVYTRSNGDPSPKETVKPSDVTHRWLDLATFDQAPLKPQLSGLELEYRIIQLYSRDAGKREAKISFNVGQGTQDIGFRNDVDILFTCLPSKEVTLQVLDEKGKPTTGSFIIRDRQARVYPSQVKRLAPDFGFHPQIYRADGEKLKLPVGNYTAEFSRGPEYLVKRQEIRVAEGQPQTFTFHLERWIDPAKMDWYSGDHHIHAAGCLHYENPTQGVFPQDMMRHILGEALNVGCVLTWGPCYYFQKQFFEGKINKLSTADNLMRYDLEVSGFPSSHSGHLVFLRLKAAGLSRHQENRRLANLGPAHSQVGQGSGCDRRVRPLRVGPDAKDGFAADVRDASIRRDWSQ